MEENVSLTERLQLFMKGDSTVTDSLLEEILPALRTIAARELWRDGGAHAPLSKTELIHEMWLTNLSIGGWRVQDRGHFFALSSLAMRRVLVNEARKERAQIRGGGRSTLQLNDISPFAKSLEVDASKIVEVGDLMDRLEVKNPDAARIVDMHYFSGFTLEEIAKETGLTLKQVRLRWEKGVKWLRRALVIR